MALYTTSRADVSITADELSGLFERCPDGTGGIGFGTGTTMPTGESCVFDRTGAQIASTWTVGCRLRANVDASGRWIYRVLDACQVSKRPDDDVHDFNVMCFHSMSGGWECSARGGVK